MKIGIFGGSFDPVHCEHVKMGESAIDTLGLDKLIIIPAHTPPHKKNKKLASDEDRLEMCRLAFSEIKKAEVSDIEIKAGGTSYTYLTCQKISEEYKGAELFLLVGTDMLLDFPTWKNPEEILNTAKIAVCARATGKEALNKEQESFFLKFQKNFEIIGYEGKKVSSTRLRVLLAAGENVSNYLPKNVLDYIKRKGLYEVPYADIALSFEKPERKEHSIRVAFYAAEHADKFCVDEKKAIVASLFHDCAKNISLSADCFKNFIPPKNVPPPVMHQYSGAYLANTFYNIQDEEILNAIRYHTSGRRDMSNLEKLIYLADMVEEGRKYDVVEDIRKEIDNNGVDAGLYFALKRSIEFLNEKKTPIYSLTREAYEGMKEKLYKNTK